MVIPSKSIAQSIHRMKSIKNDLSPEFFRGLHHLHSVGCQCLSVKGRVRMLDLSSSSNKQKPNVPVLMMPNTRGNLFFKRNCVFYPSFLGKQTFTDRCWQVKCQRSIRLFQPIAGSGSQLNIISWLLCFHRDFNVENFTLSTVQVQFLTQ